MINMGLCLYIMFAWSGSDWIWVTIYFKGAGYFNPSGACNGNSAALTDDYSEPGTDVWFFPIGSIIVKAGCQMSGYDKAKYGGRVKLYKGPIVIPTQSFFDYGQWWPWIVMYGFTSAKCTCDIHYVECKPTEQIFELGRCDNRNSTVS